MAVRIIPAQTQMPTSTAAETKKLRVAAYARVSTDQEEQENSYEAQVAHFTELINNNPAWTMVEVYADEGISATSTAKRVNFNRMIADCENHLIDMVITKSISRWARNTLDSLENIRKLKTLGIPVVFEKEGINTLDASGELLITILSSLAQQESQSISQNVRLGIQYNFQRGKPMLTHTRFIGFTKETRGGSLVIDPAGAEVVRRIFRDFLEGMSIAEIVNGLERDGVKAPGGNKWYSATVLRMLQNEKYQGDLLLQKSYTEDFLTKKHRKNNGELPQYYVENAHPPIIPREVFMIAQGELLRRQQQRIEQGKKIVPTYKSVLSSRMTCSICGGQYLRTSPYPETVIWRCKKRVTRGQCCTGRAVREEEIKEAVMSAFNKLPEYRDDLLCLRERIRWGGLEVVEKELGVIIDRITEIENAFSEYAQTGQLPRSVQDRMQGSVLAGGTREGTPGGLGSASPGGTEAGTSYHTIELTLDKLREELAILNEQKDGLIMQKAEYSVQLAQVRSAMELIDAMRGIQSQADAGNEDVACYTLEDFYRRTNRALPAGLPSRYDEDLTRSFVDKIMVGEKGIIVLFKCGIEVRV